MWGSGGKTYELMMAGVATEVEEVAAKASENNCDDARGVCMCVCVCMYVCVCVYVCDAPFLTSA